MSFPQTRLTLIQRLATGGTEEDWQAFWTIYWGPVCRFALRFGAGSLADAEEVASQTFEILLVNRLLDRWTSNRSAKLRSLLCSVVRNVLANRHRVREGRQRLLPDLLQHFRQLDETRSESSDDFYAAWVEDLLQQAVEAMAAEYFAEGKGDLVRVLYGRVCRRRTVAEVAEALEIAPWTVDSYYRQARDRLARKLEEALGEQMRQHGNPQEEAEEFAEEWQQLGGFLADHGGLDAALHRAYALLDPRRRRQRRDRRDRAVPPPTLSRRSGCAVRDGARGKESPSAGTLPLVESFLCRLCGGAAVLISLAVVVVLDWYQTSRSIDATKKSVSADSAGTRAAQPRPYDPTGQKPVSVVSKPPPPTEAELAGRTMSNSIGMELVLIPPGQFIMGTDKRDVDMLADRRAARGVLDDEHGPNEMPAHRVRITKPFYMGRFEVTQGEYQKVMGSNPSKWMLGPVPPAAESTASAETAKLSMTDAISPASATPKPTTTASDEYQYYPVDGVTEEQAEEFCKKLSALEAEKTAGRTYRLPTEAEWEYACRAGTQTAFSFDDTFGGTWLNDADIGPDDRPIMHGTKPVGTYRPNAFGLYDMHGNVWEWCSDRYDRYFYSKSPVIDPHNATDPHARGSYFGVLRGGSSADTFVACRSAFRGHCATNKVPSSPTGFRVVCEKQSSTRSP